VDDVSASFSNLGVTTTNEYNQPIPRESLVAEAHPLMSLGQQRHLSTTTFLSLPWLVKWHVYTHLHSRDSIALSSTCREMYSFNTFTYTHLQFLPPNDLLSLARSVYLLAKVLACSPLYREAVRTVRIVGWDATDASDGCTHDMAYKSLDGGIMTVLENAPHIYLLTLDFNQTKAIHYFPQTFATLSRVRTIRDLRLATFLAPTYVAENNPLLERIPDEAQPAYERVSLRVCSGGWLPVVMRNPRNLRWLGFTILDSKAMDSGDPNWVMTLHRLAEAATELETLLLERGRQFDADTLGQMLQFGFVRVSVAVHPSWQLI
jgi:hypothetical protein